VARGLQAKAKFHLSGRRRAGEFHLRGLGSPEFIHSGLTLELSGGEAVRLERIVSARLFAQVTGYPTGAARGGGL
jgi:hypothetical protein